MRQQKIITTDLGELIVALTDEVMPIIHEPSVMYMVVSYILNGLLAHNQVRLHNRSGRKYPIFFAEELASRAIRSRSNG